MSDDHVAGRIRRTNRLKIMAFAVAGIVAFASGWFVMQAFSTDAIANTSPASGETKKENDNAAAKNAGPQTPPPSVRVATVQAKSIAPELTGIGNVIPYESVALSARLNSQVVDVKFKAGDAVEKGDLLFVLDARELQADLKQAQAQLASNNAQLDGLKKEYERQELGVAQDYASKADRDRAKAAYESQIAVVQSTKALIDNLRVQISYTNITAPISGRTGTINFTQGNVVRENDTVPLVTINQVQPISVQTSLPQTSIDTVRAAMAAGQVPVEAVTNAGKRVEGVLEYIDNTIDPNSGTYVARATFANADEALWPGSLVNIAIRVGESQAELTVPQVAVQQSASGDFVYAVDAEGTATRRDVVVDRIQDGYAILKQGVKRGEQVAIDGMMSIKDGGKVSITQAAPAMDGADKAPASGTVP